jgi:hypothetical protein
MPEDMYELNSKRCVIAYVTTKQFENISALVQVLIKTFQRFQSCYSSDTCQMSVEMNIRNSGI